MQTELRIHNAESDCATMYQRASEAVADQGPGYILCTDSDEYLDRVARDLGYVCGVPRLMALTIAREFRGPQINA